jgi:hypothetical protein
MKIGERPAPVTRISHCHPAMNPRLSGKNPASNRLRHGTVCREALLLNLHFGIILHGAYVSEMVSFLQI